LSPQYTAILLIGVIAYFICLLRLGCAAAQSQRQSGDFSTEPGLYMQASHRLMDTVEPTAAPSGLPHPRVAIFLNVWAGEDMSLLTVSDFLSAAALDITNPASLSVYEAILGILPPLAWVNYRHSDALQLRLSQFMLSPSAATMVSPLSSPMDFSRPGLLPRQLTVAQLHGTFLLPARDRHALHYAIYTGVPAEDTPDNLLVGAHVSYTLGISEWTFGIDYLYSRHPIGSDIFSGSPLTSTARLHRDNTRALRLPLLLEQDKLIVVTQLLRGLSNGDDASLAVSAKPVFHINRQWSVFYSFDHLSLGRGLPRFTEHTFGAKGLLAGTIALQAEFIISYGDDPWQDAEGFRLLGTIRF
jgi:hypothetical protein